MVLHIQREGVRLPVELVDEIITLSRDDPEAMRACASVCTTWNAITRDYIFRRVRVRTEEQLGELEAVLRANKSIGHCVRELHIGPLCPPTYRESMPWIGRIPRALPGLLPVVRTLHFERLSDAAEFCDAKFFEGLQNFTSVKKLVIDDSGLNMPTLRSFACALPHLDEFVVCSLLPLMVNLWSPPPRLHRPRFTKLSISFAVQPVTLMRDFLDWFVRSEAQRTVRSLHLAATVLDAEAINTTLARVGPNLQHLSLKLQNLFKSEWEYERIQRHINISPCRKLQSLSLEPTCPALTGFLANVPTQHLQTLTFRISTGGALNPYRPNLDWLASQVEGERFKEVNAIRFLHDGSVDGEALEAGLRRVFQKLDAKGTIQVSSS